MVQESPGCGSPRAPTINSMSCIDSIRPVAREFDGVQFGAVVETRLGSIFDVFQLNSRKGLHSVGTATSFPSLMRNSPSRPYAGRNALRPWRSIYTVYGDSLDVMAFEFEYLSCTLRVKR